MQKDVSSGSAPPDPWPKKQPPFLERIGIEFDIMMNVLTGGPLGWTVSERSAYGAGWRPSENPARAARTGKQKIGWCFFCIFLKYAVQRGHCALQFTDHPSSVPTYIRASIAFGMGFAALAAITHAIIYAISAL